MKWLLFLVMTGGVTVDLWKYDTMTECMEEAQKLSQQPVLQVYQGRTRQRNTSLGDFHYICVAAPSRLEK